jgi:FixJ family two-component response regulator
MRDRAANPIIGVVDDDKSVRESLADLAESVGYDVVLFSSAEEFLRSSRRREDLGCLILDVRLPGKSGVELYTQLALDNGPLQLSLLPRMPTRQAPPGPGCPEVQLAVRRS